MSIRDKVLEEVVTDSSDSEIGKNSSDTSTDEKSNDDFEFGPKKGKTVRNSNQKKDLVIYLEEENKITYFLQDVFQIFFLICHICSSRPT